MTLDWKAVNRFILIALGCLLFAWLLHEIALGGKVGAVDVIVAIAVATVQTRSVTRSRPGS